MSGSRIRRATSCLGLRLSTDRKFDGRLSERQPSRVTLELVEVVLDGRRAMADVDGEALTGGPGTERAAR